MGEELMRLVTIRKIGVEGCKTLRGNGVFYEGEGLNDTS